jgi:hypothetical protein
MTNLHHPWPYPKTKEQIIQVILIALACVFIGLLGASAQAEHYKNKMLDRDAVFQAASSLSGYASEAAAIADQTARGRSTQHYRRAYLEQLADETQQVTEFIAAHSAPNELAPSAGNIVQHGQQLKKQLEIAGGQSQPQALEQSHQTFQQLQKDLEDIGENL